MKLLFSVLGMHPELTDMCVEFLKNIPAEIRIEKSGSLTFNAVASRFYYGADFTIGIDEDCFVFNPSELMKTIEYMKREGFAYAGMPEGGVSKNRLHDPKYTNSFFTIQNMELINPFMDELSQCDKMKYFGSGESYWSLFEMLDSKGLKRMALDGRDHFVDPITTVLRGVNGLDMLYHTWFARKYEEQRGRISKIYLEAKERLKCQSVS